MKICLPTGQPAVVGLPSQYSSIVIPAKHAKHGAIIALQHILGSDFNPMIIYSKISFTLKKVTA